MQENPDAFGASSTIDGCRFWGKILGTGADYYIVEAQMGGQQDEPGEAEEGQRANDYEWGSTSPNK